jgi:hypothetical protein
MSQIVTVGREAVQVMTPELLNQRLGAVAAAD